MPSASGAIERDVGPRSGVFADGSCEGNPGPGGWAWVRVEDDRVIAQDSGTEPATTNNRMELRALIEAYRRLPPDAKLTVYSDSRLCVDTINSWADGWARRGWRRKNGPIANLDLVKQLYALARNHPGVKLQWIEAHRGLRWNEYADALASAYQRVR
jgi:ribonuclease HI